MMALAGVGWLVLVWAVALMVTWQIMRTDFSRKPRRAGSVGRGHEAPRLNLEIVGHSGEVGRLHGRPVYAEIVGTLQVDDAAPVPVRLQFDGAENFANVEKTVILALSNPLGGSQETQGWRLTAIVLGARYVGPIHGIAQRNRVRAGLRHEEPGGQ